ncbi:hypothetical protein [Sphingomonas oryzagri]
MTITTVTARDVIDRAPLGAIIRFSDGTPQPPARFKNKLRSWTDRNGTGRLTGKRGARDGRPGEFTLHLGNWGTDNVIVLSVNRHYTADSRGTFTVERVPQPGEALVVTDFMGGVELLHVAQDASVAAAWKQAHGYPNARIEIVTAPVTAAVAA